LRAVPADSAVGQEDALVSRLLDGVVLRPVGVL